MTRAALGFAIRLWVKRQGRPTVRVLYTAAVIVFCIFLWQMSVWNLLGWYY